MRVHHVDRVLAAVGRQPTQRADVEQAVAVEAEAALEQGAFIWAAAEFIQASEVVADAKILEAGGKRGDRLPPSTVAVGQCEVQDVHRFASGRRPAIGRGMVSRSIGGEMCETQWVPGGAPE